MNIKINGFLMVLLLCLYSGLATAQVYQWTDEDGKIHYSDKKPKSAVTEHIEVREVEKEITPQNVVPGSDIKYNADDLRYIREKRTSNREHDRNAANKAGANSWKAANCFIKRETKVIGSVNGNLRNDGTIEFKICRKPIPNSYKQYLNGYMYDPAFKDYQ